MDNPNHIFDFLFRQLREQRQGDTGGGILLRVGQ
jgi:hypothetical protein